MCVCVREREKHKKALEQLANSAVVLSRENTKILHIIGDDSTPLCILILVASAVCGLASGSSQWLDLHRETWWHNLFNAVLVSPRWLCPGLASYCQGLSQDFAFLSKQMLPGHHETQYTCMCVQTHTHTHTHTDD